MGLPRPALRLLAVCVVVLRVALAKRLPGKRATAAAVQESQAHRSNGLALLAYVLGAGLLVPLLVCVVGVVRDPTLPIVARLLWLRVRELVGHPAPTEKEFLATLRRERDEQLRRERDMRHPERAGAAGERGGGKVEGHGGGEAGLAEAAEQGGGRAARAHEGGHGSSSSRATAARLRQRFFDHQPILS